jgi:hypothetical protein
VREPDVCGVGVRRAPALCVLHEAAPQPYEPDDAEAIVTAIRKADV